MLSFCVRVLYKCFIFGKRLEYIKKFSLYTMYDLFNILIIMLRYLYLYFNIIETKISQIDNAKKLSPFQNYLQQTKIVFDYVVFSKICEKCGISCALFAYKFVT